MRQPGAWRTIPAVLFSRGLSIVLVSGLAFASVIPAEHAHEIEADGHREIVVHQHAHSHAIGHAPADRDSRRAFDHPDDPILTLAAVYTTPAPHLPEVPVRTVAGVVEPPRLEVSYTATELVELLIHGPPRAPTGLRAPPTFLA